MNKKIKRKIIEACSVALPDDGMLEEIKDYDLGEVYFAYFDGHEVRKVREKEFSGKLYHPINESIVASNTVRFASGVEGYGTTKELRQELQDFIHRHVEVSDFFEKLSSYYVLLSWVYDRFDVSPYLRVIGEPGTGKSRYLQVMGAVCYKPVRVSGVITSASLFRMIDQFHGTLILEEADFQAKSDEYAAMVKILNCGHERDNPVIRQDQVGKRFVSVAYDVFCPKVIATRKRFDDQALESRMLTEKMTRMSRRTEITLNLPPGFDQEALSLRNKLLAFRFRNFHKITPTPIYAMPGIEPRILHIVSPLLQQGTRNRAGA